MLIVDDSVKALVAQIDRAGGGWATLDSVLKRLVGRLKYRCNLPAVRERYDAYRQSTTEVGRLPVDSNGYVVSFDPVEDEEALFQFWSKYGIVVSRTGIRADDLEYVVKRAHSIVGKLSGGKCVLDDAKTWDSIPADGDGTSLISRGFFEIYHDDALSTLRQAVRVYLHHVILWGRADLWTTFDRLGIKLPGHVESNALPLHVDQNPLVHPQFRTVQGVLALRDCPVERGTFVGVPGSRKHFERYGAMAKNQGEYVELDTTSDVAAVLTAAAQACPLRAGNLISWDSRTTHSNSANKSDQTRYVAYISAGPCREDDETAVKARLGGFTSGLGSNVREALMHASKPPRFTSPDDVARTRETEQLTLLGRLLYGQSKYAEIPATPAA